MPCAILRFCALFLACASITGTAQAQLAIDRVWVDMDDTRVTRADVVIRNESSDVYYITVVSSEIQQPGTPNEQRVTVTDPEQLGLLVTPNRLILRPDELRSIRIVSLNRDLPKDRIYRILIKPEIGEVALDATDQANRGIALKLLAAFDVLVTVRPQGASPELVARRIGDRIDVSNAGASNLLMLDGKLCPAEGAPLSEATLAHYRSQLVSPEKPEGAGEEAAPAPTLALTEDGCVRLPGRRLYPGNTWPITADDQAELRFMVRRNANDDLRELNVRCAANPGGSKNSDFCRIGGSDADAGAAYAPPAQSQEELNS